MGKRKGTPPGYWENNYERCLSTARMYPDRKALRAAEKGCHDAILKMGWRDTCFAHMKQRPKKYTKEMLIEVAARYSEYTDFRLNAAGAFNAAKQMGILDEVCSHMHRSVIVHKYEDVPNKESCKEHALRYSSRSEFEREDPRFYGYALKHHFMDDICGHMKLLGNRQSRCIYTATFADNHVYIGLTHDTQERWAAHIRDPRSAIHKHMTETGLEPVFAIIHEYTDKDTAARLEHEYIEKYNKEGWTVLNVAKAGALGTTEGYTKEEVITEARKYKTLLEFRTKSPGYYERGYRSDYWEEIRAICRPYARILTKEDVISIAKRYSTTSDFYKGDRSSYCKARREGYFEEATAHMHQNTLKRKRSDPKDGIKYNKYWTIDRIVEVIKICNGRKDFMKRFPGAYRQLKLSGRYEELMPPRKNPTKTQCN